MGDDDIGTSENDDPFETYIGTTDEPDDYPTRSWSWPGGVFTRPVWAIASIVIATASLLGITGGQLLAEFLSIDSGGFALGVTAPAVNAGFAAAAIGLAILGLREDEDLEATWHRALAAAAILVAVLSILVNLAAVGAGLNASDPNQNGAVTSAVSSG